MSKPFVLFILLLTYPLQLVGSDINYENFHGIIDNGAKVLFHDDKELYIEYTSSLSDKEKIEDTIKEIESSEAKESLESLYLLGVLQVILGNYDIGINKLKKIR